MKRAVTGPSWFYPCYRLIWTSLDWIFPPLCGGCKRLGSRWCGECQKRVVVVKGFTCDVCGLPRSLPGLCRSCAVQPPLFSKLRTWAVLQDPVQEALHKLKYRRDVGLGDALARQMADFVAGLCWPLELVVPVPLGRKRLVERGYNQVALIAYPLALTSGMKFAPGALARQRETRSQVGLTREARRENVQGAFRADASLVRGKVVLLMDDVATTGSTLSAAAGALRASGAADVYALTVARAVPRSAG